MSKVKMKPKMERIRSLNRRVDEAKRLRDRSLRMADKYDKKIKAMEGLLWSLNRVL